MTLWGAITALLERVERIETALGSLASDDGRRIVKAFPQFCTKEKAPADKQEPEWIKDDVEF